MWLIACVLKFHVSKIVNFFMNLIYVTRFLYSSPWTRLFSLTFVFPVRDVETNQETNHTKVLYNIQLQHKVRARTEHGKLCDNQPCIFFIYIHAYTNY